MCTFKELESGTKFILVENVDGDRYSITVYIKLNHFDVTAAALDDGCLVDLEPGDEVYRLSL